MSDFPINPALLTWARERAGLSIEQIVSKGLSAGKISDFERGLATPSLAQAELLASKLRVPVIVLLLDKAPSSDLPIPDLRSHKLGKINQVSLNFREVINDCIIRQDWYREEVGKTVPKISRQSFSTSDPIEKVAKYLAASVGINDPLRGLASSWTDFLELLVEQAELAGVLVSRSSVVRHDGKRRLNVDEFRGFALGDHLAPLVFINTEDSIAAQTFTLVHELAHICIQQSGVSNIDTRVSSSASNSQIENFCNKVAAETLVPTDKFNRSWQSNTSIEENIERVARFFRVSRLVALRCAHDRGKLEDKFFFAEVSKEYDRFEKRKNDEKSTIKEKGGNFWNSFRLRVGGKFTDAIVLSLRQRRLSYTDAAKLIGVKPSTVATLLSGKAGM